MMMMVMMILNLDSFLLFLNKQICMANPAGYSCTVVSLEISTYPSPSKQLLLLFELEYVYCAVSTSPDQLRKTLDNRKRGENATP